MREMHLMCEHCSESLPFSAFWRNRRTSTGFDRICKDCYKSFPSYAAKLERSRNGYRPPSAKNEVRRARERAKKEKQNA